MDSEHSFLRDETFPSYYANALGELLSLLSSQFTLTKPDATHISVIAGAGVQAAVVSIRGRWRWIEATITRAHPGGGAGTYDIYVTAKESDIRSVPAAFSDFTDYSFALAIEPTGVTPTIVAGVVDVYRLVGHCQWDGAQITRVDQVVPAPANHAHTHATGQPDPIAPVDIGAATEADLLAEVVRAEAAEAAEIVARNAAIAVETARAQAAEPTAGQLAALPGTSGAPGAGNKYVTDADARNTNARAPTGHHATHSTGGTDPIAPADISAATAAGLAAETARAIAAEPTAGQLAALPGTSGAPGAGNKYVTDGDARNANARAPTAHAATHSPGGTDPLANGFPSALYGDGSDGAVVFDGNAHGYAFAGETGVAPNIVYTLTRDVYATTLSVSAGKTVNGFYRIFANTSITVAGTVRSNGAAGGYNPSPGGAGGGAFGGAGGAAATGAANGTAGGAAGAAGVMSGAGGGGGAFDAAAPHAGAAGGACNPAQGAAGGAGGGSGVAGAAAGAVIAALAGIRRAAPDILSLPLAAAGPFLSGGSGGGGGGLLPAGAAGPLGGGGGGGGGVLVLASPTITVSGTGTLSAQGGAGGSTGGAGSSFGGGGGGGGSIALIFGALANAGTITAAGGAGGTAPGGGGSLPGAAGAAGTVIQCQMH